MSNPVIKDVVYYHHRIEPGFFKGKGWRGLLIRALNYFRWKLQLWCAYHTMILLALRHVPDRDTIVALKLRWDEEQEEATTKRSVLGVFGQMEASYGTNHRLKAGRKNGKWPEDIDSDPTHARMARYLRPAKQAVYTHARDSLLVVEPDWEIVE